MITAPASLARSIFSMWMRLKGVSRTQRINVRFSFKQTSAARASKSSLAPLAMEARVPAEHGMTAIPSTVWLPEAIAAPISRFGKSSIFSVFIPAMSAGICFASCAPMPNSCASNRWPASVITRCTRDTRASASSNRSAVRANTAPDAPVMPMGMILPKENPPDGCRALYRTFESRRPFSAKSSNPPKGHVPMPSRLIAISLYISSDVAAIYSLCSPSRRRRARTDCKVMRPRLVAFLLCVAIAGVFLDTLPDQPAVAPQHNQNNLISRIDRVLVAVTANEAQDRLASLFRSQIDALSFDRSCRHKGPSDELSFVRHAADASPPFLI